MQRLPRDGQDVRVFVRLPLGDRQSLDTLNAMRIRLEGWREIPLAAVAEMTFASSYSRQ